MRGIHRFHRVSARDRRMQELFNELNVLRSALDDAYMRFNTTTEPELVEACVYEINAAESRYNHQIRVIKDAGGVAAFQTFGEGGGSAWA